MIKSAYLDTAVFGGCFGNEFSESTVNFFKIIVREKIELMVSEALIAELQNIPDRVRNSLNFIPESRIHSIDVNTETEQRAKTYISKGVVGKTSYAESSYCTSYFGSRRYF